MPDPKNIHCAAVSDPPLLSTEALARIEAESKRLGDAFRARTKGMEILTTADLGAIVQ